MYLVQASIYVMKIGNNRYVTTGEAIHKHTSTWHDMKIVETEFYSSNCNLTSGLLLTSFVTYTLEINSPVQADS